MMLATVPAIPPMSAAAIESVRALEAAALQRPQVEIPTQHALHAGMYARTIRIPAGVLLTGALIKVPTLLMLSGDATVFVGDGAVRLTGYHVLPASAGRKQAFIAHADTDLTMVFPTHARTVEEAEAEFTDEADRLLSRRQQDASVLTITGG